MITLGPTRNQAPTKGYNYRQSGKGAETMSGKAKRISFYHIPSRRRQVHFEKFLHKAYPK